MTTLLFLNHPSQGYFLYNSNVSDIMQIFPKYLDEKINSVMLSEKYLVL